MDRYTEPSDQFSSNPTSFVTSLKIQLKLNASETKEPRKQIFDIFLWLFKNSIHVQKNNENEQKKLRTEKRIRKSYFLREISFSIAFASFRTLLIYYIRDPMTDYKKIVVIFQQGWAGLDGISPSLSTEWLQRPTQICFY